MAREWSSLLQSVGEWVGSLGIKLVFSGATLTEFFFYSIIGMKFSDDFAGSLLTFGTTFGSIGSSRGASAGSLS